MIKGQSKSDRGVNKEAIVSLVGPAWVVPTVEAPYLPNCQSAGIGHLMKIERTEFDSTPSQTNDQPFSPPTPLPHLSGFRFCK